MNDKEIGRFEKYRWVPLSIFLIYCIINSWSFPVHDFSNYYFGGKAIGDGVFSTEIYNALYFNNYIAGISDLPIFASYYPNTPFLAILFSPLTIFDTQSAKLCWNIVSIILFYIALHRMLQNQHLPSWVLIVLPLLFYYPIRNNIYFGQCYLFIFSMIYLGYSLLDRRYSVLYWPIAILLKSSPILLLGYLLLTKRLVELSKIVIVLFVLVLLSLMFLSVSDLQFYIEDVFQRASRGAIYDGFTVRAKSMSMLVKNAFVQNSLLNPTPLIDSQQLHFIASYGLKFGLLGVTGYVTYLVQVRDEFKFSLWIVLMLILSPTLSSYSMILLLVPFAILVKNGPVKDIVILSLIILAIGYYPHNYFYDQPYILPKFGRALSLFLLFIFSFYTICQRSHLRKRQYIEICVVGFGIILSIILTSYWATSSDNKLDYVLEKQEHIMMTDIDIKNSHLKVEYMTTKGRVWKAYPLGFEVDTFHEYNLTDLDIAKFNIDINEKHIYKSILINDTVVYYLTDWQRSPGFFTLCKMELNEKE